VVSERRKKQRADRNFLHWFESHRNEIKFISVITLGEIRRGIEGVRAKDPMQSQALENWLERIKIEFQGNILPIDQAVAERWGRIEARQPLPTDDALIAATALEHNLTVVTRNVADFQRSGVALVNPFE
jgi:predicted nucleic acid-binding protein